MPKFDETPILKDEPESGIVSAPALREHATVDVRCWPSKAKDTQAINIPAERVPDWQNRAISKFGELIESKPHRRDRRDATIGRAEQRRGQAHIAAAVI